MININSQTKLYCIFGHPVIHSLSPLMHNFAFQKLNLNNLYLAFDVVDIKKATEAMKTLGIRGASVTVPHKIELLKYLDEIDPLVHKIGACNTIINRDGKLIGYNTDWYGAITPLKQIYTENLDQKKAVLLGAGGAARAVAFGLAQEKIPFVILNRTLDKAKQLAKESGAVNYGELKDFKKYQDFEIIINTTSLGLENHDEDKTPIEPKLILNKHLVFDIVYKPKMTKFLREAKKNGAKIIYGYKMLLYQAELQFKLFTGLDFTTNEVEKILVKSLFEN